ncbi:DUF1559 domain-containing protein [Blastopirellula sp. JC732]|uniref:DUF1559 domain-containing protein n=1 Tax=Blastopirellula sediminis TaxID=2894196 RepID=A0A9X1SLQ6_9BACT|nr:DUF1559 domain-containing protein [Blastopirellula sediminis]MCC9605786.1 DUF1559 domain-containing protein [Blastopirellula sediminis]MCC9630914.1 DUF1559 domain-containing protein [Blastopirellula sediminis]
MPRTFLPLLGALLLVVGCSESKPVAQAPPEPVETKLTPLAKPAPDTTAPLDSPFTTPPTTDGNEMANVPAIPTEDPKKPAPQPSVPAAQPNVPAAATSPTWAKDLAPFLDDTTVAVIRINWPNPDLLAIVEEVKKAGVDEGFMEEETVVNVLNSPEFAKGVSEMAFIFHLLEVKTEDGDVYTEKATTPVFHTTDAISDVELVKVIMGDFAAQLPPEVLKQALPRRGEWVAMAMQEENAIRIATQEPADTSKLEAAVAAIGPAPVQFIALLNDKNREALLEEGAVPGGQIAKYYLDKVNFGGLGFAYADSAKFNLIVDTKTAEDAKELHDWVDLMTRPETLPIKLPAPILEMVRSAIMPKMNENQLSVSLNNEQITQLRTTLEPAIAAAAASARAAAEKARSRNNLKQFALGFHNFADTYLKFPPPTRKLPDGTFTKETGLSWRVHLLPYLEYNNLYEQFHLDEPWDSEHNIKLVEMMPEIFVDPNNRSDDPTKTTYVVPSGEKAFFHRGEAFGFQDFTDGTSNTIMILNVSPENAVIWTKPDEWDYDPQNPFRGLDNLNPEGTFEAALVDGSVHQFSAKKMKPETMRHLIERNDGNPINWDDVE